jgi:hypothetical protein
VEKEAQELAHNQENALLYQKLDNLQMDLQLIKEQLAKPR